MVHLLSLILFSFSFSCTTDNPEQRNVPAIAKETKELNNTASSALPDLSIGLSKKGCDNGPGVHGAVSYFVGELQIKDNAVSGEEKWLLFANQKWKEKDGKDCQVRWGLQGNKTTKLACGSCDFGVQLTNALDVTGSSCPEELTKNETGHTIQYDIDLHDDGRAEIYFAKSGKKVGEGYHKDGTIRYVTPSSCRWF